MKEKVIRFRIKAVTEHRLLDDNKTIKDRTYYTLYKQDSWEPLLLRWLVGWRRVGTCASGYREFSSVDEAKAYATGLVNGYVKFLQRREALEKYRKELKVTSEIVVEAEIPLTNPNVWRVK